MTSRSHDNCVPFGSDLAELYDDTRPFLREYETSTVLMELCRKLVERFASESVIELMEVGAGTGRLTMAIARHYHQACSTGRRLPRLRITCVDKSEPMLERLREKRAAFKSDHVEIMVDTAMDIRDLPGEGRTYHAVVAHWVFHVMSDWRVAVYAIDRVVRNDGVVFLFGEQSALYRAIDGDYRDIQHDDLVLRLWSLFHDGRLGIARRLAARVPVLPPRFRLGSRVVDDRIDRMFAALGWSDSKESGGPDRWWCEFSLDEVIEKIIRPRAFTNMRLFADEGKGRKAFEDLADDLKREFTAKQLKYRWRFTTEFSGRMLAPPQSKRVPGAAASLVLHVARDTLGRRWRRRLDHTYDREALWRRLFTRTWDRLNREGSIQRPLAGIPLAGVKEVEGVFAAAPFAHGGRGVCCTSHGKDGPVWSRPDACWTELTSSLEGAEPFAVVFEERVGIGAEEVEKIRGSHANGDVMIHPHVHTILVNGDAEKVLKTLRGIENYVTESEEGGQAFEAATRLRGQEPLRSVLENAKRYGAIPFRNQDAEADFVIGLARIAADPNLGALYVFPFRADFRDEGSPAIGFLVGAKRVLGTEVVEFLWALADVIFNEYLEDVLVDRESMVLEGYNAPTQVAIAEPRVRQPANPDRWRHVSAPAVLLVTAADVEFKAVIELAGVVDTLEERRRGISGEVFYDLGFPNLPVWAIQCEIGSVGPGASSTTVLSALKTLNPKPFAVIMPGIAFGLQPRKQHFGDVLVSKQIHLYEVQKRNPLRIISRGDKPHCSDFLLRYLRGCQYDWQNASTRKGSLRPQVVAGLMLSGEKLVDDPDFVYELSELEPEAIGGEMEAAGVYSAAQRELTHWIIVKAVCDWGLGKGNEYQKIAAQNSVDFIFHALGQDAFADALKDHLQRLIAWVKPVSR
jgi:nucleoside phosphorylase/ubiquinone/menaquinone biosynthesis C-methylase UbiE